MIANTRDYYRSIRQSTSSLVFLATPHKGSSRAGWSELTRRLSSFVRLGAPSTAAAEELELFSATLQDINKDFSDIANTWSIVSFWETRKTPHVGFVREYLPTVTCPGLTMSR